MFFMIEISKYCFFIKVILILLRYGVDFNEDDFS